MPERRHDPLLGRTTIFASERAARPFVFGDESEVRCPFCIGNEADTPHAIANYPQTGSISDEANWQVRVVPNKYPAVSPWSALNTTIKDADYAGLHEVIIASHEHLTSFSQLTLENAKLVFRVYQERIRAAKATPGIAYAQLFTNVGVAAGASIEHLHSQAIALGDVPTTLQEELVAARRYLEETGSYWHEKWIADARRQQSVVCESEHLVAICPTVPRFAYETWILPVAHAPRFEDSPRAVIEDAALLVHEVIRRLETVHPGVAYNYLLHTAPFDTNRHDHYHWHIELFPRLAKQAGFEWASGWHLNTMTPEAAAQALRDATCA